MIFAVLKLFLFKLLWSCMKDPSHVLGIHIRTGYSSIVTFRHINQIFAVPDSQLLARRHNQRIFQIWEHNLFRAWIESWETVPILLTLGEQNYIYYLMLLTLWQCFPQHYSPNWRNDNFCNLPNQKHELVWQRLQIHQRQPQTCPTGHLSRQNTLEQCSVCAKGFLCKDRDNFIRLWEF